MTDREFITMRINELQNRMGISSRKMSTDLGYNEGYINHILSGRKTPSLDALCKIVEYFEISRGEFFHEDRKESDLINALNKAAHKLSDRDLKLLITLATSMLKQADSD